MNYNSILLDNATLKYASLALNTDVPFYSVPDFNIRHINPYIFSLNQLLNSIVLYDNIYYVNSGKEPPGWLNSNNGFRIKKFVKPLKVSQSDHDKLMEMAFYRSQHFFKDPSGILLFTNMLDKLMKSSPKKAPIPYLFDEENDENNNYLFNPEFFASEELLKLYLQKRHFAINKSQGIRKSFEKYYKNNIFWDSAISFVYWTVWRSNYYDILPSHYSQLKPENKLIYSPAYSRSTIANFPYSKVETDNYQIFIKSLRYMDKKYIEDFKEMTNISVKLVNVPNFIYYLYKESNKYNIIENANKLKYTRNVVLAKKYINTILYKEPLDIKNIVNEYNEIKKNIKKEWGFTNKKNYEVSIGTTLQNFGNLSFDLSFKLAGQLGKYKSWLAKRKMQKTIKLFRSPFELNKEFRIIPDKYYKDFIYLEKNTKKHKYKDSQIKFISKKEKRSMSAKRQRMQQRRELIERLMTWGS